MCSTPRQGSICGTMPAFLHGVPPSRGTRRDAVAARARPLRGAQANRRTPRGARPARKDRADHAHRSARRPLRRGDRAVPHRPMVRRRQDAGGSRRSTRCARASTVFVPAQWEATFFNWMENIQPWCISRQIWWGHQIPAWYGPDGKIFVAENEDDAVADALAHYTDIEEITVEEGHDIAADPERRARFANEYLHRDEDVLDTWFSSALWPFSTLGWPDETPELKRYLPDQRAGHRLRHHLLLGRAHDDDGPAFHERSAVPHRLHPRAGARRSRRQDVEVEGQRHRSAGTDRRIRRRRAALHACRHGGAGPRHQALGRSASRAIAISRPSSGTRRALPRSTAARAIPISIRATPRRRSTAGSRTRPRRPGKEVTAAIEAYKFNEAAAAIYRFVWNIFCDWYLELAKPVLTGADGAAKDETRATAAWALRRNPQAAAPVHAVHHRGALGRHRGAGSEARPYAGACRLAAARRT